jgi:ATP diphosphatase
MRIIGVRFGVCEISSLQRMCGAMSGRAANKALKPSSDVMQLLAIMAALRNPETGCPWDIEQDFASIAPYAVEEAHEVAEAVARGDMVDLCEELGDLLLQVVFHAQMAREAGYFDFGDVVEAITSKLIRRHPHVFGDGSARNPAEVAEIWAAIKVQEKAEKATKKAEKGTDASSSAAPSPSLLDGVPPSLPGLTRAVLLQQKASTVGFDWNDPRAVLEKFREEIQEVEEAFDKKDKAALQDEIGDMLFVLANLARHAGVDPEIAVESTNKKFRRRFAHIEQDMAGKGRALSAASLEEMDALWDEAKALEKAGK